MKLSIIGFLFFTVALCAQDLYDDTKILELYVEFPQSNWQQVLKDNVAAEKDIPATLTVNGVRYDSIGIRYKGNSSYNIPNDKKPFNISMDSFKPDQLLMGYSTLNLNNGFKDPTYCREKIAYELASRYMPAVKTAYVKLYINGVYWGLYLNVQQPNKKFLRENFGNATGNYYKGDPRGDLQWFGNDTMRYKNNYEKKTNETIADWADLVHAIDVLNNTPQNKLDEELPKVMNVDRALWYVAFCNVLVNLDSYIGSGHNYYVYNNPVDGRFSMIPWDMNEVLGVFQIGLTLQQLEQLPLNYGVQRPFIKRMIASQSMYQRYLAHTRTLMREMLDEDFWKNRMDTLQNLIRASVQSDTKKLYDMNMFTQNTTANVTLNGQGGFTIPGILSFIKNRKSYLNSVADMKVVVPPILQLLHYPEKPFSNDSIIIRAMLSSPKPTTLWYSINGGRFISVPMHDMNMGAIWYGATLAPMYAGTVVRYYVETSDSVSLRYFPERAEFTTQSFTVGSIQKPFPVVINELLASNANGLKDPQGQNEDWFELYNTSDTAVMLGGKYITDDANTHRWKIPDGTSISANGYLLIWADEDTTDTPGLHANFKLSKSGEALALYDSDANGNVLLDSVSFGVQADDVSLGRYPNGSGPFKTFTTPTPNAENATVTDVRVDCNDALRLHPNPADTYLEISTSEPIVEISVFDALGNHASARRMNSNIFDLTQLHSGMYYCKTRTSTQMRVLPFIVVR